MFCEGSIAGHGNTKVFDVVFFLDDGSVITCIVGLGLCFPRVAASVSEQIEFVTMELHVIHIGPVVYLIQIFLETVYIGLFKTLLPARVSSANDERKAFLTLASMSPMRTRKRRGPRTDPWGTPERTGFD